MGARKSEMAKKYKAEKQQKAIAVLRDCPTSPRKMRLVADIIRGVEINKALGILRYSKKEASIRVEKLLKSAIANWEAKNPSERLEDTKLCVKEIFVDGGRMYPGSSPRSRTPYSQAFESRDDRSGQNGNRRKQVAQWDRK